MPGQILVVNKKTHKPCTHDVYIGRPSVLGNPFSHLNLPHTIKVSHRSTAVGSFERMLNKSMNLPGSEIAVEMAKLLERYCNGETIHLVCWCAPLECHGEVIKNRIEDMATVINLYKGEEDGSHQ